MSLSQFHRIKWFILRHAWLNLWDKHMTTGRINQVTYADCATAQPAANNGCALKHTLPKASRQGSLICHVKPRFPHRCATPKP